MPILEKYRHYFDIDPDYFPAVNEALINSKPDLWKKFFPHDTFIETFKNLITAKCPYLRYLCCDKKW